MGVAYSQWFEVARSSHLVFWLRMAQNVSSTSSLFQPFNSKCIASFFLVVSSRFLLHSKVLGVLEYSRMYEFQSYSPLSSVNRHYH
jgi:hypothetical protein